MEWVIKNTHKLILKTPKFCSCGKMHISLPSIVHEIPNDDICGELYFFNCECKSTLTVKKSDVRIS